MIVAEHFLKLLIISFLSNLCHDVKQPCQQSEKMTKRQLTWVFFFLNPVMSEPELVQMF